MQSQFPYSNMLQDQPNMYNKLKAFEAERRDHQTSSTFKERLRFWKKEKDRSTCLKALKTWNKRLLCLTEEARKEPVIQKVPVANRKGPSQNLRAISRTLYRALAKYWRCGCDVPHEARFCLKPKDISTKDPDKIEVDYDFLFSATADRQSAWTWLEGTVIVRSKG